MIYIFFSNNKWFLHSEDLPVKPRVKDYVDMSMDLPSNSYYNDLNDYEQVIADIKAKALEIANPELVGQIAVMPDPVSESVNGTVFYQWPGTFEKKETLYANDKYEVKYKTEVAHLVLPPEEKNMTEDELRYAENDEYVNGPDRRKTNPMNPNEPIPPEYYLNGPDEFVPNESTSSQEEQFRKALQCLYIAVDEQIARDINNKVFTYVDSLKEQLTACRQSLNELIPIAEKYALTVDNPKWLEIFNHNKSAIEQAKALIK